MRTHTQKKQTTNQQIRGIEVKSMSQGVSQLALGSLSGVLVGALITLGVDLLNEYRQSLREIKERRRWLRQNLPHQLRANRQAVEDVQETHFELWRVKWLTEEGYHTELRRLTAQNPDFAALPQQLTEVGSRLQDYESLRLGGGLGRDPQVREDLLLQLDNIIDSLGRL